MSAGSPIPLLVFASSPAVYTLLLRPFSNALETLLLAVALHLSLQGWQPKSPPRLAALGAVLALGFFTRITFVAFAAPLVVDAAWQITYQPPQAPKSA